MMWHSFIGKIVRTYRNVVESTFILFKSVVERHLSKDPLLLWRKKEFEKTTTKIYFFFMAQQ